MFLHVANGHSTTELIERSGVPGLTMVWCDPLHDGPVPGGVTDEELLRVRAEFLASSADSVRDVAADLASWRATVDNTAAYDELVLWFEHDLFDQLNLVQLLARLERRQPWPRPVTLIGVDQHPRHPDFKGLGELAPGEIADLFPSRQPLTADQLDVAARAWSAIRSSDPTAIESLLRTDTSALPFLAAALSRHLEEFPSERDGLSRTERRLLELVLDGPVDLRSLLPRMHDGERALHVTDVMLLDRARALASVNPPLVSMSAGAIAVTAAGRDVLDGKADRVQLCGIDRWIGGVHLTHRGPDWRWHGTGVRLRQ